MIPDAALRALAGTELVVHLGDIVDRSALDALIEASPRVAAVRSRVDPPPDGEIILDAPLTIRVGDRRLVAISHPDELRPGSAMGPVEALDDLRSASGEEGSDPIHLLAYRGSHAPALRAHRGCLMVDPGSPTAYRTAPTVAVATVSADGVDVEVVWLSGSLDRTTRLLRMRDGLRMQVGDRGRALARAARGDNR